MTGAYALRYGPFVGLEELEEKRLSPRGPGEVALHALVMAARDGRAEARTALLKEYLPVVLGWCARLGGPRVDAEDAAQDVWMVVLRRLHELDKVERFPGWVYGITRRVLAQHRRRAWVTRWTEGEVDSMSDGGATAPEAWAYRSELSRAIFAVLQKLPERQREVLVLMDLEERTAPEVAQLLSIPEGTVYSRLRLARQRFTRTAKARGLTSALGDPDQ